jgi:hypothetical protein
MRAMVAMGRCLPYVWIAELSAVAVDGSNTIDLPKRLLQSRVFCTNAADQRLGKIVDLAGGDD